VFDPMRQLPYPIEDSMSILSNVSRLLPALIFSTVLVCSAYAQQEQPRLDVPYVPTPPGVVKRMLELAKVGKDDFVIDLGSGDGRIAIAAARDFGARSLGVDIDPQRIQEANENASKAGVTDRVTFRRQNLFETEIKDANAITMYLLSSVNLQLRPRLLDELRPGTRLVSHAFGMAAWQPDVHEKVDGRDVFLWIVPAKAAGQWRVKDGSRSFTMQFFQNFQELNGAALIDGRSVPLVNGRLTGESIVFTLEFDGKPLTFQGKVSGDRIEATDGPLGPKRDWSAARTSEPGDRKN
jgi:SAM-dependent methyltransferase